MTLAVWPIAHPWSNHSTETASDHGGSSGDAGGSAAHTAATATRSRAAPSATTARCTYATAAGCLRRVAPTRGTAAAPGGPCRRPSGKAEVSPRREMLRHGQVQVSRAFSVWRGSPRVDFPSRTRRFWRQPEWSSSRLRSTYWI